MNLVVIHGKSVKNANTFVLIPPDTQTALEILQSTRDASCAAVTNEFLFAQPNADSSISGTSVLRELIEECPLLEHPERITTTKLHKYIAIVSQILEMKEQELGILATRLGHDPKTHKEYYQLSSATVELTTVSRLLMVVENGGLNSWKGQNLTDINFEEIPVFRDEVDESVTDLPINVVVASQASSASNSASIVSSPSVMLSSTETNVLSSANMSHSVSCFNANLSIEVRSLSPMSDLDDARCSRRGQKRPWSDAELSVFTQAFKQNIADREMASSTQLLEVHQQLNNRTVAQIRARLNNVILGKQKLNKKFVNK